MCLALARWWLWAPSPPCLCPLEKGHLLTLGQRKGHCFCGEHRDGATGLALHILTSSFRETLLLTSASKLCGGLGGWGFWAWRGRAGWNASCTLHVCLSRFYFRVWCHTVALLSISHRGVTTAFYSPADVICRMLVNSLLFGRRHFWEDWTGQKFTTLPC